jgi:hypothetical protein
MPDSWLGASVATVALLTWICSATGTTLTESRTVDVGSATSVRVAVELQEGDVRLSGGAATLLEATFSCQEPHPRPEVVYRVTGGVGTLTVRQSPTDLSSTTDARSRWDLRIGDMLPITLSVHVDAGDATLDLGTLRVKDLVVDLGTGDLDLRSGETSHLDTTNLNVGAGMATLDLTGEWRGDSYVRLNVGAGDASIFVPRGVGVWVRPDVGIGTTRVTGLLDVGDGYRNREYGTAPTTLVVAVTVGAGEITVGLRE